MFLRNTCSLRPTLITLKTSVPWWQLSKESDFLPGQVRYDLTTSVSVTLKLAYTLVQFFNSIQLFVTPWTAAHQASLSITNSRSLLKLMSIESLMPSNPLILYHPLLLLPSAFLSIRVFSNESVLWISGQSIGISASASVLPMNIQDFRMETLCVSSLRSLERESHHWLANQKPTLRLKVRANFEKGIKNLLLVGLQNRIKWFFVIPFHFIYFLGNTIIALNQL